MVGLIRRFSLLIMLVSAVAIPYAMVGEATGPLRDTIQGFFAGGSGDVELVDGISDPEVNRLLAMQQQVDPSRMQDPAGMNLTPTVRLEGVLRFDVTPRWVLDNWPHVSTTRISGPLDGLRVPLITGTGASDVVGSLTYYFDHQQQVQRISVDGIAGDDRQVVSIVTRTFELKPEPTAGVGIYLAKWNGKPTSALWIRRMPVVHANNPYQKFEFALELNRPSNYFGLSRELQNRIEHAHASLLPPGPVR